MYDDEATRRPSTVPKSYDCGHNNETTASAPRRTGATWGANFLLSIFLSHGRNARAKRSIATTEPTCVLPQTSTVYGRFADHSLCDGQKTTKNQTVP